MMTSLSLDNSSLIVATSSQTRIYETPLARSSIRPLSLKKNSVPPMKGESIKS